MKKKIVGVLFLVLVIHQFYWYSNLDGNLIVYVSNVSEKDSVEISLLLDNNKINKGMYINSNSYSFKNYPLTVSPGKHTVTVETKEGEIKEKYTFYSFLIKRVIIEYQGEENQLDDNKKFLLDSESVFGNFIIE
jgi:hypothetical protein